MEIYYKKGGTNMASWKDTFKSYLTTDTMKNPLDTLFPNLRKKVTGENPPVIKPSPIKAKAKDTVTKAKEAIKTGVNKVEKTTSRTILIVGAIGIIYLMSKGKN